MSYLVQSLARSSAIRVWQPWGHSEGVPMAQLADTSSGGERQYGNGMRHDEQARGRIFFHSASRIA